jgi:hypothetical protein
VQRAGGDLLARSRLARGPGCRHRHRRAWSASAAPAQWSWTARSAGSTIRRPAPSP